MRQAIRSVTLLQGAQVLNETSRADWTDLVQKMRTVPFFMLYESIAGYLNHLRDVTAFPQEPVALQLKRDGRLAGALVVERESVKVAGLRVRALTIPVHPHVPRSDMLLPDNESLADFWPQIKEALTEHRIGWAVIRFPAARMSSAAWAASQGTSLRSVATARLIGNSDYFDCRGSYETLASKFGKSLSRRLGQAERQLDRMGRVDYRCVDSRSSEGQAAYEQFLVLEAAGWKGQEGTAIALSAALTAYYRDLFVVDTPEIWGEVHLLSMDDKIIAAQLCNVSGRTREVLKLCYDESLRKQSPGNVLMARVLRATCIDARTDAVSMVGRPDWIDEWRPDTEGVYEIMMYRSRLIAELARSGGRVKRLVKALIRKSPAAPLRLIKSQRSPRLITAEPGTEPMGKPALDKRVHRAVKPLQRC